MNRQAMASWRRAFNRYVPLFTVFIGLILILSSLAVVGDRTGFYARVIIGIVLVMAGFLYASHPFMTSERRHLALRDEVENFIQLVRQLNRTAISIGGGEEFDEVKAAMRESLARIEELAGKEG